MNIRLFDTASDEEYTSLAELRRAVLPEYVQTVSELREMDCRYQESGKSWNRWLAINTDGTVIGMGEYTPALWQPGPGKYFVRLQVHPQYQGQGIGKALYQTLWEELEQHHPTYVKSEWREDMARAVRFFQERGFTEVARYYESRLDLTGFDLAPFADDFDKPLAHGIVFRSWRELKATDPDADRKMWRASMDLGMDVPSDEPFAEMAFDEFQSFVMNRPNLDPDGFFIAIDEQTGEYAGLSHIWRRLSDNDLNTGLTGVKRAYRRRGIALALKLRIVRWAIENGYRAIRTENDISNRPMLSINERLGFAKIPPWIEFVWKPK